MNDIHILLVDDHPVIRTLLRQVLEAYSDIVIVAEAEDGEEAVKLATIYQPAVAVIDLHLPKLNGIEATKLIRFQSPWTAIIGLTAGEPDDREIGIISAGASAVLNKADVFQELYPSIIKAVRLASFYPARLDTSARSSL
jgi:two-component system, NarL family, response regulator LiaR